MTREEAYGEIGSIAEAMIAHCDEIADRGTSGKVCNLFLPREARKRVDLVLAFIAALAQAPSMALILELQPLLTDLQERVRAANAAVMSHLPPNCRSLITCISSGEQFFLNLLLRGDSTALVLAKLLRPLAIPLRQLFLIFAKKLHEQLTVGC